MATEPLHWQHPSPCLWRSTCNRYALMAVPLPEHPVRVVFQARWVDQETARAYPHRGDLGVLLGESPWLWTAQNSVAAAETIANRHADALSHAVELDIPDDYAAIGLDHFYWPVGGTPAGRAALVIQPDPGNPRGGYLAQVVSRARRGGATVPCVWAEIDLTGLGLVAHDTANLTVRTDHGPGRCPDCGVNPGRPHDDGCDQAICVVTGEQRLLCRVFGDSPTAGMYTLATGGDQQEFEDYFKAGLTHDCGKDIWYGESIA